MIYMGSRERRGGGNWNATEIKGEWEKESLPKMRKDCANRLKRVERRMGRDSMTRSDGWESWETV